MEFNLAGRESSPWQVDIGLTAGATTVDTEDFQATPDAVEGDLTYTYPYVGGGIEIGYEVTDALHVEVGSRTMVTFSDRLDLEPLYDLNLAADPTDQLFSLPISLGLRWDLPNMT